MIDIGKFDSYKTTHWGDFEFTPPMDWGRVAKTADGESYLCDVGFVGVDSGSVTADIRLRDVGGGYAEVTHQVSVATPDGDGRYRVLAGYLKGIGRCMLVAFDGDGKRCRD